MRESTLITEATMGGPGLNGYVYRSDHYCIPCGERVCVEVIPKVASLIPGIDDPLFRDPDMLPQPMFFQDEELRGVVCCSCGDDLVDEEDFYGDTFDAEEPPYTVEVANDKQRAAVNSQRLKNFPWWAVIDEDGLTVALCPDEEDAKRICRLLVNSEDQAL